MKTTPRASELVRWFLADLLSPLGATGRPGAKPAAPPVEVPPPTPEALPAPGLAEVPEARVEPPTDARDLPSAGMERSPDVSAPPHAGAALPAELAGVAADAPAGVAALPSAAVEAPAGAVLPGVAAAPPERRGAWVRAAVILLYSVGALWYVRHVPASYSYERYLVANFVCLFFVPLLVILLGFGDRPEAYALSAGDRRASLRLFLTFFLPMLVVLAVAARWPAFQSYYPIYAPARFAKSELLFWEVAYNGMYMLCWEFYFRGFLTHGLRPAMGNWAIHLQAIVFGAMHWGKPMPEFYASFFTGYVLGLVALRARSFLPTWALHCACAVSFDLFVLAWGGRL